MKERDQRDRKDEKENEKEAPKLNKVKAAMFVPHTVDSGLAKELRELEYNMEAMTGHRLKITEKAGSQLEDLLTSSNPWKGVDCGRDKCLLCETKLYTGKLLKQECDRRNLVYETVCITCEERDTEEIEKDERDDKKDDEV